MADTRIAESILSGEFWIERVQEGEHLRLTDLQGNQAIDTIFYNAVSYTHLTLPTITEV